MISIRLHNLIPQVSVQGKASKTLKVKVSTYHLQILKTFNIRLFTLNNNSSRHLGHKGLQSEPKKLLKNLELNLDSLLKKFILSGCPGKCSPIKILPENNPPEIYLPGKLPHSPLPRKKVPPKVCFSRFLLLLTLPYSCSFLNLW